MGFTYKVVIICISVVLLKGETRKPFVGTNLVQEAGQPDPVIVVNEYMEDIVIWMANPNTVNLFPELPPSALTDSLLVNASFQTRQVGAIYQMACDGGWDGFSASNIVIGVKGKVPDGCDTTQICNATHCLRLGIDAMLYARLSKKDLNTKVQLSEEVNNDCVNFPFEELVRNNTCHFVKKQLRRKREVENSNFGLHLGFNLPERRYCGPSIVLNPGQPFDLLDDACKRHRLEYSKANSPFQYTVADKTLLNEVQEEEASLFPIFFSYFKAKDLFESEFKIRYNPEASPLLSFSRCSASILPMRLTSYVLAKPTPKEHNDCPLPENFPYNFLGRPIQSTGQRLIANLHYYYSKHGNPGVLGQTSTTVATAKSLNVGISSVLKIVAKTKHSLPVTTPGKTRKRKCPVRDCIDAFDQAHIRNIVTGYYQKNLAPLFEHIYKDFIQSKEEDYKCSRSTFRIILRALNYRYLKINTRAVLTMRPAIVIRRGYFLRHIFANEELGEDAAEVVYLDETWIDQSTSRIGKAWMPRQFESFREATEFSYKDTGSATGRLVVLAAADSSGIIRQSILVYHVRKSKTTEDYHDNVNYERFSKWFITVLEELKKRNKKFIIVMDNASYHSSSSAPLLNSRKQVLYDFLETEKAKLGNRLREYKKMKLYELKKLVRELKQKHSYYKIEELAKPYNIPILRTPPWNCELNPIELAWKDMKHSVRLGNTALNTKNLIALVETVLTEYSTSTWQNHLRHVKGIRQKYWDEDHLYDSIPKEIAPIIITSEDMESSEEDADDAERENDEEDNYSDMPTLLASSIFDEDFNEDNELEIPVLEYSQALESEAERDSVRQIAMKTSYDFYHNQWVPPCSKRKATYLKKHRQPPKRLFDNLEHSTAELESEEIELQV